MGFTSSKAFIIIFGEGNLSSKVTCVPTAVAVRKSNEALSSNADFVRANTNVDDKVYVYFRQINNKKVLVILNFSNTAVKVQSHIPLIIGNATELFSGKSEDLKRGSEFDLKPWGYLVYEYN